MSVTANMERRHAFVVNCEDARKIWELLEDSVGKTEATAQCSDDMERKFSNSEDLLAYENPRGRQITQLCFTARSSDRESRVDLTFSSGRYHPSIRLHATGPEALVSGLKQAITDKTAGIRPWYSPAVHIDFLYIVGALVFLLIAIAQVMVGTTKPSGGMSLQEAIGGLGVIFGVFGLLALLIWGLNALRRRYFPVATFAIGQGERRYDFDEKIRWIVFVGLLVSVAGSIIAALLGA